MLRNGLVGVSWKSLKSSQELLYGGRALIGKGVMKMRFIQRFRQKRPGTIWLSLLVWCAAWEVGRCQEDFTPVRDVDWIVAKDLEFPVELRGAKGVLWLHSYNAANAVCSETKEGKKQIKKWEEIAEDHLSALWRIITARTVKSAALKLNTMKLGPHSAASGLPPFFGKLPVGDRLISVIPLALIYRDFETGESIILSRHRAYYEFMETGNAALLKPGDYISSRGFPRFWEYFSERISKRSILAATPLVVAIVNDVEKLKEKTGGLWSNIGGQLLTQITYAVDLNALRAIRMALKSNPVMTVAVSIPLLGQTLTVSAEIAMMPDGNFNYRLMLDKVVYDKKNLEAAFQDISERFGRVRATITKYENRLGRTYDRISALSAVTGGQKAGLVTASPENIREAAGAVVQLNMAATALNAAATSAASLERTLPQLYELASQLGTLLVFAEPFSSGELILQYAIVKGDKVVVLGCNY